MRAFEHMGGGCIPLAGLFDARWGRWCCSLRHRLGRALDVAALGHRSRKVFGGEIARDGQNKLPNPPKKTGASRGERTSLQYEQNPGDVLQPPAAYVGELGHGD